MNEGQDEFSVSVDMKLCVGHGRCYELAPDIFDEDEAGYCTLRRERIPKALVAHIKYARSKGIKGFCIFTFGIKGVDDMKLINALSGKGGPFEKPAESPFN